MRKFIIGTLMVVSSVVLLYLAPPAFAVSKGYETRDTELRAGMVVASDEKDGSRIERADQNSAQRIVGVATTFERSSLLFTSGGSQIPVAVDGTVSVYVGDMGGDIVAGDVLSMSPVKGVLMKYAGGSGNLGLIVGRAAEAVQFADGDTYKGALDSNDIKVKLVRVNLDLPPSSIEQQESSALTKLGKTLAGKDINELRILAALIIFVSLLVAEGAIIYGSVTSSVFSLGRNPLARHVIFRGLSQVLLMAGLILIVGLGAMFAVIRL